MNQTPQTEKPVRMQAVRAAVTILKRAGYVKGTPMVFDKTVMMAVEVPAEATMTKRRKATKHHKKVMESATDAGKTKIINKILNEKL